MKLFGKRSFSSIGRFTLPTTRNEEFLHFRPGSKERDALVKALAQTKKEVVEIPCVVGGKEIFTGDVVEQVMPTKHSHVLARVHKADAKVVQAAVEAALKAKESWSRMSFTDRAAIFAKAADRISAFDRAELSAAVMLGTGKNPWQAEIDAAVETIDFFRFNNKFAEQIYAQQPTEHAFGSWNRMEYRPLEGFIFALTPFNFLAIGANLPGAPALMGNTIVWKPSTTASLGNYKLFKILQKSGLPDGVINFVPGSGPVIGAGTINHQKFAGLHFTGGTETFNTLWQQIGKNLDKYGQYPRIVGETGGKNFHLAHPSADIDMVVNQTIRGAFEYSGQKCSATSRAYIPSNLWPQFKEKIQTELKKVKLGQPDDFEVFVTSVIDRPAFKKITKAIEDAKKDPKCTIIAGGTYDDSEGFFIQPTVIQTTDPHSYTMKEELFGPVLTVYVYDEKDFSKTLKLIDTTTQYALTGAVFSQDRAGIVEADEGLRYSAGNFYINDKSTGAVVGQQPFGGARASGTNDKAGSAANLMRWVSMRTIKENYLPQPTWRYPHMEK